VEALDAAPAATGAAEHLGAEGALVKLGPVEAGPLRFAGAEARFGSAALGVGGGCCTIFVRLCAVAASLSSELRKQAAVTNVFVESFASAPCP
jgi:hypothetical protein